MTMTLELLRDELRMYAGRPEGIHVDPSAFSVWTDAIDDHLKTGNPVAWRSSNPESIKAGQKYSDAENSTYFWSVLNNGKRWPDGVTLLYEHPAQPQPVAQGEAVAEMSLHDRVEFALRDAGFDLDEASRIAGLTKPWTKGAVAKVRVTHAGYGMELSQHVAYALPDGDYWLYATPAIPTGERVVPVEPTEAMIESACEAIQADSGMTPWDSPSWEIEGKRDHYRKHIRAAITAALAASPSAGGV